jgi:hypothetical protein
MSCPPAPHDTYIVNANNEPYLGNVCNHRFYYESEHKGFTEAAVKQRMHEYKVKINQSKNASATLLNKD